MMMLNGEWKLYPIKPFEKAETPEGLSRHASIDAIVPGNVELDMAKAGMLPEDLFRGMNITLAEEFETYEWWYEKDFITPEFSNRLMIKFKGVDCYAQYWLNGKMFGASENSLIEHEFDITDFVNPIGESNKLFVYIKSTMREINKLDYNIHELSGWGRPEFTAVRKQAHSFGWDIMPRALSAGIWRDVRLYNKEKLEISQLQYIVMSADRKMAELRFFFELDIDDSLVGNNYEVTVTGKCKDSVFEKTITAKTKIDKIEEIFVENPYLWWPAGYGEPNLYEVTFTVSMDGIVAARKTFSMGIRTVSLKRTPTTDGSDGDFRFIVNGEDIMCRGTNWVPMDAYHSRDAQRYEKALEMVTDIGCNILRLWGGNVYEQEDFYDYCDQHGIMVWQDFAMGCAVYSHKEEFCKLLEAEATQIVRKLRNHPCIILWAGDNECDLVYSAQGIMPDDNILTRKVLKDVCRLNDVTRPYLPSSPYFDGITEEIQGGREISERHLWGPRDYFKSDFYKQSRCHFISEIGYHGCPNVDSLEKFIDREYLWPDIVNEQWVLHSSDQKNSPHRVKLMTNQIKQLFDFVPETLEEYVKASQYSQAEAKKYFIEMIRCKKPLRTGVIWWNLIDGWPQISDAVVDYYYGKKEAYEYIKRAQKPVSVIVDELKDLYHDVVVVNDTMEAAKGSFKVYDIDTNEIYAEGDFEVEKNCIENIAKIPMDFSDKKFLVIEWTSDGKKHYSHYLCGMPAFDFEKYNGWIEKFKRIIK